MIRLKKLVLVLMVVVSLVSFSEYSELLEAYVSYPEEFENSEGFKENKVGMIENAESFISKGYMKADLLKADIELDFTFWSFMDKTTKYAVLVCMAVYMYDKTDNTDMMIKVDNTTVFWCSSGTIISKRVY